MRILRLATPHRRPIQTKGQLLCNPLILKLYPPVLIPHLPIPPRFDPRIPDRRILRGEVDSLNPVLRQQLSDGVWIHMGGHSGHVHYSLFHKY